MSNKHKIQGVSKDYDLDIRLQEGKKINKKNLNYTQI